MTDIAIIVVWTIASYLLGVVPFGDIVARIAGVDIRSVGTRNPGAANVYREIGPKHGIAVFALDVAKGVVATAPMLLIGETHVVGPSAPGIRRRSRTHIPRD